MKPSARKMISSYFILENQLKQVRSVFGAQLDQLKEDVAPQSGNNQQERLLLLYLKCAAHMSAWTAEEQKVCQIRYGSDLGALTTYEKRVPESALTRKTYEDGSCELVTSEGETLVCLEQGHAVVIGWKRACVSYQKIAALLGMSAYEVKLLDHSACQKVRDSLAAQEVP